MKLEPLQNWQGPTSLQMKLVAGLFLFVGFLILITIILVLGGTP